MKTLLVAVVLLSMTATMTWAAPFLVATQGAGGLPVSYNVEGLGVFADVATDVPAQSDGNFRLDLANLPQGSYTVRVRAKNLWGVSEWSDPFQFTKAAASGKPTALRLLAQ